MSNEAQDFREQMERWEAEPPTVWKPDPGGLLLGPILDIDGRTTAHSKRPNDCPVLTVRNEEDETVYEWWAFHDVAKRELAKLKPRTGERIAVRYLGRHEAGYYMYKIRMDRQGGGTFNWGAVEPDPAGLPPDSDVTPTGDVLPIDKQEPQGPPPSPFEEKDNLPF